MTLAEWFESHPKLKNEWDTEANAKENIFPENLMPAARHKAWWRCSAGHSWQAVIYSRTKNGNGCPYCSRRRVDVGVTDLMTVNPELAKSWDYEKNDGLTPHAVMPSSLRKVWWKCERGHSWQATIRSRAKNGNGCPYCGHRQVDAGVTDLMTVNPELARSWDYEKNNGLTPQELMAGSDRIVWWKCEEGHSWQARISSRHNGNGCPYCGHRQVDVGFTDLMSANPEVAKSWDYEKNNGLTPQEVMPGSNRKVWWICESGHSWKASIASRTREVDRRNCPYCSNKQILTGYNDFATVYPELMHRWDYEKNELDPTKILGAAHKWAWWKCERGHSWQTRLDAMVAVGTETSGCPYCNGKMVLKGYNDLLFLRPEIAKEWCYELNDCAPDEVTVGSKKKVWWKCELGHTWQIPIHARTGKYNTKCPYCRGKKVWEGFNDLKTVNPRVASEWCDRLNGDLKPTQVTRGAKKKVWWECTAGHVWEAFIYARTKENGTGCPVCAGTVKQKFDE